VAHAAGEIFCCSQAIKGRGAGFPLLPSPGTHSRRMGPESERLAPFKLQTIRLSLVMASQALMRILFSWSNFHLSDGDEESLNDILFALELTGAERDFVSIYETYTHTHIRIHTISTLSFCRGLFFSGASTFSRPL
jgi:hypothetical protein